MKDDRFWGAAAPAHSSLFSTATILAQTFPFSLEPMKGRAVTLSRDIAHTVGGYLNTDAHNTLLTLTECSALLKRGNNSSSRGLLTPFRFQTCPWTGFGWIKWTRNNSWLNISPTHPNTFNRLDNLFCRHRNARYKGGTSENMLLRHQLSYLLPSKPPPPQSPKCTPLPKHSHIEMERSKTYSASWFS